MRYAEACRLTQIRGTSLAQMELPIFTVMCFGYFQKINPIPKMWLLTQDRTFPPKINIKKHSQSNSTKCTRL